MNRLTAVLAASASLVAAAPLRERAHYEAKFYDWLQTNKVHVRDGAQFQKFLANFIVNDDFIAKHNEGNHTYELGHNQFSHMTYAEWIDFVKLGLAMPDKEAAPLVHSAPKDVSAVPASVDWTTVTGIVTPVKDQGQCGSCWAFSSTGALEGAYAKKYAQTSSWSGFSEQHLVSCNTVGNHGCHGGLMDRAFTYVEKKHGLCSEAAYPYTSGKSGVDGECLESTCTLDTKLNIKSHTDVQTNSDDALMSALAQQPVAVAIQANQPAFQFYKSGVMTEACGASLDHGVLAVGYGTLDGTDYYKVKNSWGASWGMDGYILLQRGPGINNGAGQCGILSGPPSYPNMA